jgi:23S rRNA pseudouridine1911/1915/1917 synthase
VKTLRHELRVPDEAAGQRIDLFLGEKLSLSRNKLKALFEGDSVRVDGKRTKKGAPLVAGQTVVVSVPDAEEGVIEEARPLTVLFEDEVLIAVEKPAGLPSYPLKPNETGTVANALVARWPQLKGIGNDPKEAGLCHRLDTETSGVLLAAKRPEVWDAMRKAFSTAGLVDKRYVALVSGPLADEGEIDLPLVHAGDHVRPALPNEDGRPALSSFQVIRRIGLRSLVEVRLHTGVLHQVRAHLAGIGAPIVGDTRYGGKPLEGLTRFFLHASGLAFEHPVTHAPIRIACELPPELMRLLESS